MSDTESTGNRGTALSEKRVSAILDAQEGVFQGGPPDPPRHGEGDIQDAIRAAHAARVPVRITGAGTKAAMLRPVQADRTIRMDHHTGITLYAPKELVFSARAGTTMADVDAALAACGQHMIAEPPDYARLLGAEAGARQTFGGVVSANLAGPRRVAWGSVRDHVLGVRAINGTGGLIRSGGRVLKNVTGLDLCKLLTGAHGTLGVLTEITVKVLPAPETSASVMLRGLPADAAVTVLSAALGSPFGVSGAAFLPESAAALIGNTGTLTVVRIEDSASSVAYRIAKLHAALAVHAPAEILDARRSVAVWRAVRDADVLAASVADAVWRVSVRPSRGPAVLAAVVDAGGDGYLDWGGGLIMAAGPATEQMHAAVTHAARMAGGVWTLLRASAPWRETVQAVPPEAPALSAITRRVKAAFDPLGILNPGRIFAGI